MGRTRGTHIGPPRPPLDSTLSTSMLGTGIILPRDTCRARAQQQCVCVASPTTEPPDRRRTTATATLSSPTGPHLASSRQASGPGRSPAAAGRMAAHYAAHHAAYSDSDTEVDMEKGGASLNDFAERTIRLGFVRKVMGEWGRGPGPPPGRFRKAGAVGTGAAGAGPGLLQSAAMWERLPGLDERRGRVMCKQVHGRRV